MASQFSSSCFYPIISNTLIVRIIPDSDFMNADSSAMSLPSLDRFIGRGRSIGGGDDQSAPMGELRYSAADQSGAFYDGTRR